MIFRKKHIATALLPLALNACFLDDDGNGSSNTDIETQNIAVVATRAADYSSGAHAVVNLEDNSTQQNLNPAGSDLAIRADGEFFYRIGRYGTDTISRYASAAPATPLYTYSTQDAEDEASSNPYDIITVEEDKAYILRYGAGNMWIVDPSSETEAGFIIGDIDLSSFDADGVPEMAAATEAAGLVFVLVQRLSFFEAVSPSLLIAIDIATDEIIDLDPASDALALELPVYNASDIQVRESGAELVILAAGGGSFTADYSQYNPRYDGGIVTVSLADYTASVILDDGNETDAPYGEFMSLAEQSDGSLWLVAGDPNFGGTQSLYRVDEVAGSASNTGLPDETQEQQITTIQNQGNELWLGVASDSPQLIRLNATDMAVTSIPLELVPLSIDFAEVPVEE